MNIRKTAASLLALLLGVSLVAEPITPDMLKLDPALPAYKPAAQVSGKITVIARDRLDKVTAAWAALFKSYHPKVECVLQSDGQGNLATDPTWTDKVPYRLLLVRGNETRIVFQKRQAQPDEIDEFSKATDHFPFELPVACFACNATGIHTYAIVVHKDNPLEKLALTQVDAIFSRDRRRGAPKAITTWGQLGVTDKALAEKPIHVYGRDPGSPAQDFRDIALLGGQFIDGYYDVADLEVAAGCAVSDKKGIAYTDNWERTDLKVLPISVDENSPAASLNWANVVERKYPILRHVYAYTEQRSDARVDPLAGEFLRLVLSKEGQAAFWKEGILPFNAQEAGASAAKIR